MNFKSLLLVAGLMMSGSTLAEECLPGFGPGCVTPGPDPTPERIPIPQYLSPVWTGVEWVVPTCKVVDDDFVGCFVSLPGGYRVGGLSASCPPANTACSNLWTFAFTALQSNRDAALRAASAMP